MGGSGAGFLDGGLGEGLPPSSQRWGAGPQGREAGVLGLLQTHSVTWPQFPQMSLTRGRPVREEGEDTETAGLRVPQTWALLRPVSWLGRLSALCLTRRLCERALARAVGGEAPRCHPQPTRCPSSPRPPLVRRGSVPPHRWFVDHRRENSPSTQHRAWRTDWCEVVF